MLSVQWEAHLSLYLEDDKRNLKFWTRDYAISSHRFNRARLIVYRSSVDSVKLWAFEVLAK